MSTMSWSLGSRGSAFPRNSGEVTTTEIWVNEIITDISDYLCGIEIVNHGMCAKNRGHSPQAIRWLRLVGLHGPVSATVEMMSGRFMRSDRLWTS